MAIGNLVANLSVNSAPFKKGLGQAKGKMKSFASGMGSIMKGGVVAGLGLATVGVFKLTQQLSELDKIAKLSARTGFDPKTIAGFGFAVEQSGGSVESANKSLDKFTKNMGEALSGTGPAKDAIEEMGLSMADISSMSPEDQLLSVSQAISELPTEAQRAKAAFDLFGRGGQEMVGVFAEGEQGIRDFMAEADDLGLGFDKDELANVEAANDAINRMKRSFGAIASTITVQVAPAIEGMATGIQDMAKGMGGFGAMADSTFSFVGDSWTWLQDKIAVGITAAMAIGEWAFTNWQAIGELAIKAVALGFVEFNAVVHHFFTKQVPGYLAWFSDNFGEVMFTALDYTLTLFINLGKNIRAVWQAVLDFFSTGTFSPDFTPLLEGARSTIASMPDIPERVVGEVESALANDVAALQSTLSVSFDETVSERLRTLAAMQDAEKKKKPTLTAPDGVTPGGAGGGAGSDSVEEVKKTEQKFAGVQAQGSSEAFSLLAKSSQQMPQVKEQKETNKILRGMAKVMERQKERNESLQEVGIA
jgi:hypothetical protein